MADPRSDVGASGGDSAAGADPEPGVESGPGDRSVTDRTAGVAPAVASERAWARFQESLGRTLPVLENGQYLMLNRQGTGRYVQLRVDHDAGWRVEVASAAVLGSDAPDEGRYRALLDGGWLVPTDPLESGDGSAIDRHGSPDWFLDARPPVDFAALAVQVCAAFRGVFQVEHPGDLEYRAGDDTGAVLLLPTLGLHRYAGGSAGRSGPKGRLRPRVEATLCEILGLEELVVDADGDIPIRDGDAMVFVRVVDDPPLVQLFSPLVMDVTESVALHRRLSELTRQRFLVRFQIVDGTVLAGIDLLGEPFVAAHLGVATAVLGGLANEIDAELQAEFGGRVFFGDEHRPKPPPGTGGYL